MSWYNITKNYNNIEYKYGSWNKDEGLDCLSMVLTFLKDTGIDLDIFKKMSYNYKGKKITMFNYHKVLDSVKEGSTVLKFFIEDTFEKVDKLKKGNIIFYDDLVGIYIGNNTIMTVFENGRVKNLKIDKNTIKGAYKWAQ